MLMRKATVFLLCIISTSVFAEAAGVGKITRYRGGAFAINEGQSRNLAQDTEIMQGDRIVTGENTRIEMEMVDGAVITLGDFTYFKIEEYQFDEAAATGNGELSILRGVFRAVTGKLGKLANKPFKVTSPLASIGIRGTDFWGEQSAQKFEIALLGGEAIVIGNEHGEVVIDQVGDGTTIVPSSAPTTPKSWGMAKLARAASTVD